MRFWQKTESSGRRRWSESLSRPAFVDSIRCIISGRPSKEQTRRCTAAVIRPALSASLWEQSSRRPRFFHNESPQCPTNFSLSISRASDNLKFVGHYSRRVSGVNLTGCVPRSDVLTLQSVVLTLILDSLDSFGSLPTHADALSRNGHIGCCSHCCRKVESICFRPHA